MEKPTPLAALFNYSHISAKTLGDKILLIAYTPIGLWLLGIRLVPSAALHTVI